MNVGGLVADGTLWVVVPLAALAGLLSFLSPCVLPLVPGYLGFVAGSVAPRRRPAPVAAGAGEGVEPPAEAAGSVVPGVGRGRLVGGVLLFVAGFTVVFLAMTVLGGALGLFLLAYQDVITRVLGAVVIVLGLVFIGVFGLAQRTVRPRLNGNLGLVGAPLLGVALGIGWTPCIGPTLGAILSLSWNLGDPGRAALLGLAYSAGLGVPFVLLALGLGWASRSVAFVRRHIRVVNVVGGSLLVVLGVLMVTGAWSALMSSLQGVMSSVPLPL